MRLLRRLFAPGPPLSRRNHLGAWIALLTCPCHLGPILLVTAGTGFGASLYAHRHLASGVLAAIFVLGLVLLFRRDRSCPIPR